MKKRNVLVLLAMTATLGMSACGDKELTLTTSEISAELGSALDTSVASYVADADVAAEATIDFSAVDMTKVGTYNAVVSYKDQTADITVNVEDTTAPVVETAEKITVEAGKPLYAENVITGITELGGEVEVAFKEPEAALEPEAVETTETTESVEVTEATEIAEGTESAETVDAEFTIGGVTCNNASVIYPAAGEYDNTLTVTDASGNSTEVPVHIVAGEEPEFSGIGDMTVETETKEVNFLDGVSAKDFMGNDITKDIVCDSSAVDLMTEGEYQITYTVTDENGFTASQTAKVTVEKVVVKKPDTKKEDTAKKDTGKKDNGGSKNSGNTASTGTSGNTGTSNTSGSNGNSGSNNNSGNSNNNSQPSGGNTASNNSGNTSTPSTPSTDNGGNTNTPAAPSTPAADPAPSQAPSTPSADSGNTGGEMQVPEGENIINGDDIVNPPIDQLGGSGEHWN